jgi:hypothetical protein
MQLGFSFFKPGSLSDCLTLYLRKCASDDQLRPATLQEYSERAEWLRRHLGPATPVAELTVPRLEKLIETRARRAPACSG